MSLTLSGSTGITTSGASSSGGGDVATNTALGGAALAANTTGANNTAVGYQALDVNTTGASNIAIGTNALGSNTTGANNVAVGSHAMGTNSTGIRNVAMGHFALYENTTGQYNTAIGYEALNVNTTGANNTAVGYQALYANTTGTNNTAVGYLALDANTTGVNNTAVGSLALGACTTGVGNTVVGFAAGGSITTGSYNTFIGRQPGGGAGDEVTTGSKNTIIGGYNGNQFGLDIRTASNYIVLSDGDGNLRGIFDSSGNLLVGKSAIAIGTSGVELYAGGEAVFTKNAGPVLYVNRLTDDGDLVRFFQATVLEGNISVSGSTVSYNGGHLSRWAQMLTKPDLLKGTVMSNLDEMNVYIAPTTYWTEEDELPEGVNVGDVKVETHTVDNEQLNKVKVSDVEGDVNVAGVFVNWTYDEAHQVDEINMAMTGDMIIRIAQGVTVQKGDLLMSAGDGTAKPQDDDIVRSKTVAKVTSNHVTCTYADGSYCVPCVLMAC